MRIRTLALPLAALVLAATPAAAKTIRVAPGGADANEKLQEALILAEPGDVVELGAGTWTLTETTVPQGYAGGAPEQVTVTAGAATVDVGDVVNTQDGRVSWTPPATSTRTVSTYAAEFRPSQTAS